ncbi:alpha-amylase family glycosyl hydrolase [Curtobacterium sp. Leaf261]|uniref:alpha-amylase family glycosyl hydrolase n=1 Tax=Curtobacterium sp. Leaf261 TaxID=1736311 RepID=UPI0006F2D460|nr:alpha-amylase family glycosyl hydrolase [Curtobacterium sp. Leaf261]KQO64419.1 alpha-amylase [Curtobacterium sp. Leaf261]
MPEAPLAWVDHVMWWHVYPLGFVGAPVRPPSVSSSERDLTHRLGRIEGWLDLVVELGLNGLQLGPVFDSATHGYDTIDHFRIDPRLGDDDDFDRLLHAAHERGIRVILDGVFNHVSREHPAFVALADGPDAPTAGLFRVRWDDWRPGDPIDADVFEGHKSLPALDHSSPAVVDLVVDVMDHWLDRGIDGWRLDVAHAVPASFWAAVLPRVRERHPGAWITGEVIHGDAVSIVRESTMDSVTQYALWQGIWHGIADRNFFETAHAIEQHDELLATFVPSTFVGNHDTTRIATAVGDPRHLPHALAVLFTVAGTPGVYAGDEYGMLGVKEERLGGDDAVRPAFPDVPPQLADLPPDGVAAYRAHQALIGVRREFPWLHSAHTDVIHLTNTAMVLRTATGSGAVVTALNLGDDAVSVPVADATRVVAGGADLRDATAGLPAHGWAVLAR